MSIHKWLICRIYLYPEQLSDHDQPAQTPVSGLLHLNC